MPGGILFVLGGDVRCPDSAMRVLLPNDGSIQEKILPGVGLSYGLG